MSRPHRLPAALALVAAAALAASPALAYFDETAVGSRGVSLGFSALACTEDVSAGYWNPAGLAGLDRGQILFDYSKPYGVPDLNEGALMFGGRRWNTGWSVGWHRLGIAGAYAEDAFSLSAGRHVWSSRRGHALDAGATYKWLRAGFQPFEPEDFFPDDGAPVLPGRVEYGWQGKGSLDLGLLWTTPWKVDFAWVGRDLAEPHFEFVPGSGGGRIPFRNELAAVWRWNRESILTAGWSQVDRVRTSVNVGFEITFYDVFAIRSGLTNLRPLFQSNGSPNKFQYTGGFGIYHNDVYVDTAVYTNHDLGASYRASVRVPVGGRRKR
jgi:hypothetical protein